MYKESDINIPSTNLPSNHIEAYNNLIIQAYRTSGESVSVIRLLVRDLMPLGNEFGCDDIHDLANAIATVDSIFRRLSNKVVALQRGNQQ
jgi:hypothetical protein